VDSSLEEVSAASSRGETLSEAKANLLDALQLVLECQRDLAKKTCRRKRLKTIAQVLPFVQ
jgi:hypothetical protein